eukprot:672205_1
MHSTGNPDGHPSKSLAPICTVKSHQSGVNALDCSINGDVLCIVSGGDDQAIGVWQCQLSRSSSESNVPEIHTKSHTILPDRSSSAITALKLLGNRVYSAGLDERLDVWELSMVENSDSQLIHVASEVT